MFEIITLAIILAAAISALIAAKCDNATKETISNITGK